MKPCLCFRIVAGRAVPKDVPILNSGTHEYVVFPKGLLSIIKVHTLKERKIPWILQVGPNLLA